MNKHVQGIPLGLLGLTIGKLLFSPNWETAAAALIAGLVVIAYEMKNRDKELEDLKTKFNDEITKVIKQLETHAATINNHAKAYEDMKTHVSGLNLAKNLKTSIPVPIERIF